ncbi:RHS repeat-associated core domain-containing protein [Cupriavidus numazuensis]|uniref:Uncharacterized protein n=3 Tax=Cupriavidus numazuensis TaxID=221992 RepID=A0ABM8TS52_9BURK|nr:RHS repeat-associated core domain-containing protein [Cupriavidus numazuensis]CAG2159134.1 hypothetical protein LMG26411_06465 [Cupriavidus numazuensis]
MPSPTTAQPAQVPRPVAAPIATNAEQRRVIVSPARPVPTRPNMQAVAADSIQNHSHELFIQCLYMLPVVGNAMSLWDVGTDIYHLCKNERDPQTGKGYAESAFNWGILAIDAIGVVPAAGNASRPARAVVKEVLLAFAKGLGGAVLVDIFWATASGDVIAFMSELDKHLQNWREDIIAGVQKASRTVRRFVENPVSAGYQMGVLQKKEGFLSWVPSTEEVALVGIDQLLKLSGERNAILAWLTEFDRNAPAMIHRAIGDVTKAGSLMAMAAAIVMEIKARRGPKLATATSPAGGLRTDGKAPGHSKPALRAPSHQAHASTGARAQPHTKPGEHRDTTQKPAQPSHTPAKDGCGCPPTASRKPVNFAMGDENLEQVDFALDGVVPIVWTRRYRSSLAAYDRSSLGARWSSPYHLSLAEQDGVLTFFDPDNRAVVLPVVAVGESVAVEREKLTVTRPDARRVQLHYPDGSREDYALHRTPAGERFVLTRRTGQDGLGLTFSYSPAGELTGLTDSYGLWLRLDYSEGRVSSITRLDRTGEVIDLLARYEYSREGDLIAHTDVLGHRRSFAYTQHLLTRCTDFNGFAAHLEWDWPGKASGTPAPADARCVHTWRCNDRYPAERYDETFFAYHREHWYTKVTDGEGSATLYRYDWHNQIILIEQADGTSDSYEWDARGNLVGMKNAAGEVQRFGYDEAGRVTEVTDALGNTTRTEYNEAGLPVKVTSAAGDVTLTDYDAQGRPVAVTDAAKRTTQYQWSGSGLLLGVTDPKGGTRQFDYDSGGRLVAARDCSGYETRYGYDLRGHLLTRTDAEGQVTRYRHDARGQLLEVTGPDGIREWFAHDGEGNLTEYTDGAGQVTSYGYNGNHQPHSRVDAAGRQLAYTYDRHWRLVQLRNENDQLTTFRYDKLGQLVEETGFDGKAVRYAYDGAGRLAETRSGDIWTEYTRDSLGRLTQRDIHGTGRKTTELFYYDQRGRLTTAETEGSKVRLHYDDAGNLVAEEQHVRASFVGSYLTVTRHEYDALGNRTRTTLPNTRTVDWLRYGSGHVHGVQLDGKPLLDFERDKLHRETGRKHAAFLQQREYDPAGRLARLVVKPAHPATPHDRIAERRLRYSAAGHLTRIDDRARGVTEYGYDPVGRLLQAVTPDQTERFAFDPAGNPIDPARMTDPPKVETPQERAARRSIEDAAWRRDHPDDPNAPRYDERAADEWLKFQAWKKSLPKWLGNVMQEYLGTRYEHDAQGNLTRRSEPTGLTWLYEYDAANRLTCARRYASAAAANEDSRGKYTGQVHAELTVNFQYDAFGRRTLKEVEHPDRSVDRTVFTWDGDVLLLEERFHAAPRLPGEPMERASRLQSLIREDPADPYSLPVAQRQHTLRDAWQAVSLYLHEPGTFVPLVKLDEVLVEAAHFATGTDGRFIEYPATTRHATYLYQNDHLGTPQELLDESGKVVWLGRYRAWGALKGTKLLHGEEALTGNAIRAQGQYHDEETGLYYNRHRYYDPYSGRFITQDPIGLAGGVNLYQYAPNSTGWVDPLGLTGDDTLKPGPYATESIPARGPERNFTVDERNKINAIGRRDGCHTCGTKDPGKKSGDFILDHQTANALNEDGKPQRLYPHCLLCSRKQAGQVTQAKKRRKGAA